MVRHGLPWLVVGLGLASGGAAPAAAQPADVERPDVRRAERELERARWELEEIVGSRLLGLDPPPLPEVPPAGLSAEEKSLMSRLLDAEPGEWRAEDRARVSEFLVREEGTLAAASSRGESVATAELMSRALPLLQGSRLLALRDRLAFAEGREVELVAGLETRLDLATRLWLQPGVLGPLLGTAIYRQALRDVRALTVRPATTRAGLERLEALLYRWRLEVPDPAAVVAREGLIMISTERANPTGGELLPDEAGEAVFAAPLAQDLAELARRCRDQGCRAAVEGVERGLLEHEDPYRVIADMMIPNLLDAVRKFAGARELTHLAQLALALRLDALERGSYPADLDGIASGLGLTPDEAAELAYERRPDGGARLRLVSDRVVTDAPEMHHERLRPLLTWDLPPVSRPSESGRMDIAPAERLSRPKEACEGPLTGRRSGDAVELGPRPDRLLLPLRDYVRGKTGGARRNRARVGATEGGAEASGGGLGGDSVPLGWSGWAPNHPAGLPRALPEAGHQKKYFRRSGVTGRAGKRWTPRSDSGAMRGVAEVGGS